MAHLRKSLPDYMLPAAIVAVPRMPLTSHGKVDRRGLREPEWASAGKKREGPVRQATPTEEALGGIWEKLLGLKSVGAHANFFEQGGHSITAAQVVGRAGALFGVALSIGDLFEEPTIAGLARRIDALRRASIVVPKPAFKPRSPGHTGELSFCPGADTGSSNSSNRASRFQYPFAFRLTGILDVATLESCFNRLLSRHASLTTSFTTGAENPRRFQSRLNGSNFRWLT